jgi:hypothetical protein
MKSMFLMDTIATFFRSVTQGLEAGEVGLAKLNIASIYRQWICRCDWNGDARARIPPSAAWLTVDLSLRRDLPAVVSGII